MNQKLAAKYLQLLRKQHGFTQEDLAKRLSISRQAVSKWETNHTMPDLDILLALSKIYHITINEILEPSIEKHKIKEFEQIIEIENSKIKNILSYFRKEEIVKASMGASLQTNNFLAKILPEINFKAEQAKMGPIRIDEVEEIQNEVVSFINLL